MGMDENEAGISTQTATSLSILYTLIYVLPFYLSPQTRPSPTLNRDAPSVIAARIRTVSVAGIVTTLTTFSLIVSTTKAHTDRSDCSTALHLLGYYPVTPIALSMLRPLLLTALLFLGPLFEKVMTLPSWSHLVPASTSTAFSDPIWVRNYIAGPVTEEILFRSVIIPLHILAELPASSIIFITPLFFGVAHVHHLYEFTLTHPRTSLIPAVLRSLSQFTYTTIFGWYASFLYVRTGCLVVVILVHSFCNWCGLPRFWGRLELELELEDEDQAQDHAVPPPIISNPTETGTTDKHSPDPGDRGRTTQAQGRELPLMASMAYYTLLFAGAYAFKTLFWTLTDSPTALLADF